VVFLAYVYHDARFRECKVHKSSLSLHHVVSTLCLTNQPHSVSLTNEAHSVLWSVYFVSLPIYEHCTRNPSTKRLCYERRSSQSMSLIREVNPPSMSVEFGIAIFYARYSYRPSLSCPLQLGHSCPLLDPTTFHEPHCWNT
jgi:hypothetical protein